MQIFFSLAPSLPLVMNEAPEEELAQAKARGRGTRHYHSYELCFRSERFVEAEEEETTTMVPDGMCNELCIVRERRLVRGVSFRTGGGGGAG